MMHNHNGKQGPTWLYKYFDKRGTLLYIGASAVPFDRRRATTKYSWGHRIASGTMRLYQTRRGALIAEKRAIGNEKPKFNIIHSTNGNQCTHGKTFKY